MKKALYIISFISFFSCSKSFEFKKLNFNNEIEFIKTYGGSSNDVAKSVAKTADLGYIVLGYTQSKDGDVKDKKNEDADFWVLKFSSDGNLNWKKTYGGSASDKGNDIIQTKDRGYAVVGYSKSKDGDVKENAGNEDYWIAKLSANGTIKWQKSLGFEGSDIATNLVETKDGGFLVTGQLDVTASKGKGDSRIEKLSNQSYWIIKLNAAGEKQWSKYFGGTRKDIPHASVQLSDESFIIVGVSESTDIDVKGNKGSGDFWGIRIAKTGDIIWKKNYGGSKMDIAYDITESGDGNYIIAGTSSSNDKDVASNKGNTDGWAIKISPYGDLLLKKSFGETGSDDLYATTKSVNGGFIFAGAIEKSSKGKDAWIIKTNTGGTFEWQRNIGGNGDDIFHDVVELYNGSIVAVGETTSVNGDIKNNKGGSDVLIVKIK